MSQIDYYKEVRSLAKNSENLSTDDFISQVQLICSFSGAQYPAVERDVLFAVREKQYSDKNKKKHIELKDSKQPELFKS